MSNLTIHDFCVSRSKRESIKSQKSCTIWLYGLSASGKSTIANLLDLKLNNSGYHTYILDGDNTRFGINKDLGFSDKDRIENIRRVSEVSKILNEAGIISICSFISPFLKNREDAKKIIGEDFIEFFVDSDIEVCETRDPKGLYKKARIGEIKDFTGISSPFEVGNESIVLKNNVEEDISKNVDIIIDILREKNIIK